jgi:hypothetical protein
MDVNLALGELRLEVPIFKAPQTMPSSVYQYVQKRRDKIFLPHATRLLFEEPTSVLLSQTIPFSFRGLSTKEQTLAFCRLAKHCHDLLMELAVEEIAERVHAIHR